MLDEEAEKEREKQKKRDRNISQGDPDNSSDSQGDDSASDDSQGSQGDRGDGSASDDFQHGQADKLSAVLTAGDEDLPGDIFEAVKQLLGDQPAGVFSENCVMPTALDPEKDLVQGQATLNKVLNESGRIRTTLQGLVQASRHHNPIAKRSGNRVASGKMVRLAYGDTRVFIKNARRVKPNTAVHILLDGSSSMADTDSQTAGPIVKATEASVAMALVLDSIPGVNPAITRFPGRRGEESEVFTLVKHGQKVRSQAAFLAPGAHGNTPLAEALWYAAAAVLRCREERKIIMVVTDGQPDEVLAAKTIITKAEQSGIEVVGIGIDYDVSHLFERSICINDVGSLRSELL